MSRKENKRYRLPTEAEWEYACRCNTATVYSSGDEDASLAGMANVADASLKAKAAYFNYTVARSDGHPFTAPVWTFRANRFGLFDMHGNVWEWCADSYDADYYKSSPAIANDPQGPSGLASSRVYRGGGWDFTPQGCRSADRSRLTPDFRSHCIGFRVALVQSGQ